MLFYNVYFFEFEEDAMPKVMKVLASSELNAKEQVFKEYKNCVILFIKPNNGDVAV